MRICWLVTGAHSIITVTTAAAQVLERKKLLSQAANAGLLSRADKAGLSLAKVVAPYLQHSLHC